MDVTVQIPDDVLKDAIIEKLKTFKPVDPFPNIMDKRTCAKYLHCGRGTLDGFIKNYGLPVATFGSCYRFRKADVDAWVKARSEVSSRKQ